jgi:hypothetical protein
VTNRPTNFFTEKIPRTPNLESTKISKPSFSRSPLSNNKSLHVHCTKENISGSSRVCSQECKSVERKRSTPKYVHASINQLIGKGSTPSKVSSQEGTSVERKRSTPKSVPVPINHLIGGGSTPSKADVKTKIARYEAVSKTIQSSVSCSKATKAVSYLHGFF